MLDNRADRSLSLRERERETGRLLGVFCFEGLLVESLSWRFVLWSLANAFSAPVKRPTYLIFALLLSCTTSSFKLLFANCFLSRVFC